MNPADLHAALLKRYSPFNESKAARSRARALKAAATQLADLEADLAGVLDVREIEALRQAQALLRTVAPALNKAATAVDKATQDRIEEYEARKAAERLALSYERWPSNAELLAAVPGLIEFCDDHEASGAGAWVRARSPGVRAVYFRPGQDSSSAGALSRHYAGFKAGTVSIDELRRTAAMYLLALESNARDPSPDVLDIRKYDAWRMHIAAEAVSGQPVAVQTPARPDRIRL